MLLAVGGVKSTLEEGVVRYGPQRDGMTVVVVPCLLTPLPVRVEVVSQCPGRPDVGAVGDDSLLRPGPVMPGDGFAVAEHRDLGEGGEHVDEPADARGSTQ